MTTYINTGAKHDGSRVASKTALKKLVAAGEFVVFDKTAGLFDGEGVIGSDNIPAGVKLSVCGPDPYESRKWFATVEVVKGKIKVT